MSHSKYLSFQLREKIKVMRDPAAIILLSLVILFNACSDPADCLKSTGSITTEERILPSFTTLIADDNIQVILTPDSGSTVMVEAGKHLLSKIRTRVEYGVLRLTNENTCNWVRSYDKKIKVYIGIKNVRNIFHYGFESITCDYLTKDTLFFHHYGNGDVHLKLHSDFVWMDMDQLGDFTIEGTADQFHSRTINLGELKAQNFMVNNVYHINDGQSNSYIAAPKNLTAVIQDEGNIYYYQNPSNINYSKLGKGNLFKGD